MKLTALNVTGPEAQAYFEELLSGRGLRIGPAVLARREDWSARTIVPEGTSAEQAAQFRAGGVFPTVETWDLGPGGGHMERIGDFPYVWLSEYLKEKGSAIRSLLWEDCWMKPSDFDEQNISGYSLFYHDGCAYSFQPNDELTPSMIRAARSNIIMFDWVCYCSQSARRNDVLNAASYAATVREVLLPCYDMEGLVLFGKKAPAGD